MAAPHGFFGRSRPTGAGGGVGVRAGFAALLLTAWVVLLGGCASAPEMPRPLAVEALPPQADGPLAAIERDIAAANGPETSGFNLLERNDRALLWRLALIDSARQSIDLQYYVWFGDELGRLMMFRVIEAAGRGVRVRILIDDLNTMLHDMSHPELRDDLLVEVSRHPNIEIRVFNAWRDRSWFGRVLDAASDFERLNRRMHNKQMIVDNRAAIIGGRNLGNEYFGLNPDFNFHDLDVIGVGPVARQASEVFDRYWNSAWVSKLPEPPSGGPATVNPELGPKSKMQLAEHPSLQALNAMSRQWEALLASLPSILAPGRSQVHTDSPARDRQTHNHMPEAFRALMRSAQREVLVTNAYIIPDAGFIDDLRTLTARGVRVGILTNSLSSHDVPAVNSHYRRWRKALLEAGVQLFELRADAAMQQEIVDLPPLRAPFVGLHTKAMVIDRQRSFVGSMNLDPRSEILNAEMGVIIDSPLLAEALAERMTRDMSGANSWRPALAPDGSLRWQSEAGELDIQPARSFWQRVEDVVFQLFPANLY